jgi:hypothetical protein
VIGRVSVSGAGGLEASRSLLKVIGDAGQLSRDALIVLGIFSCGNRPKCRGPRPELLGKGSSFHGHDPPSA